MLLTNILEDKLCIDIELTNSFIDWDKKGLVGCSCREYHILLALASLNNVNNILELGPGKGASTETLLMGLRRKKKGIVVTVDIIPNPELILITDRTRLTVFHGDTNEFFAQNIMKYDLVFVDANHTDGQSYRDIDSSLHSLNENGVVACHDLLNGKNTTDIHRHTISLSEKYGKKYKMFTEYGNGIGLIY